MNRRAFLVLGGSISGSGCLGWDNESQKQIEAIHLVNNRTEAYTIEVVIENDGENVFTDKYQLGTSQNSSTVSVDTSFLETGQFVLRFRVDNQWVSIYSEEYESVDGRCVGVYFELHPQGTTGYKIQPSTDC